MLRVLIFMPPGKVFTAQASLLKRFFFLAVVLFASGVMATEEPKFSLLEKSESFELRAYAPQILAEVTVNGDLDSASNQGFRLIAGYIFGQNQVSEKIAMTAPVVIESGAERKSAKIAMTAPVSIEANAFEGGAGSQWTVSFVMPSEYTLETLPKPLNTQVKIREVPAEKRAVITFSGFYNEEKVLEKTRLLEAWIQSKNWQAIGSAQFARYNPPWTLPFMRRNEVMIRVRD